MTRTIGVHCSARVVDVTAAWAHSRHIVGPRAGFSVAWPDPIRPLAASPTPIEPPTKRAVREGSVVKHKNRLVGFESATDLMTVGLIIALGLAMVIGLLTASGSVTW